MLIKEPLKIKNVGFSNRIVMPPMASEKTGDGMVDPAHLRYYTKRCGSGHIGLVITEHMYIHPRGQASPGQISIASDSCIPGLKALTDAIHEGGARCFAQINHAGYKAPEAITGRPPLGPSALETTLRNGDTVLPEQLSEEGIAAVVSDFAAAALRAKKAGYDGVEIHAAHGYLLCQFYSPLSNKRSDGYGGSLEKRLRLHLEVIRAVREAVGEDFIVAIRFGGCDYMPGGSSIEDCAAACGMLEAAGLDLIDLSGGHCGFQPAGREGTVCFEDMARASKPLVSVPVILTGGIVDAGTAERLLREKTCDMVGIGRALLKDAQWPEHQVYTE